MFHYKPLLAGLALSASFVVAAPAAYAADDTILLGSAISLTGKYATAGNHAKVGYDFAVDINQCSRWRDDRRQVLQTRRQIL